MDPIYYQVNQTRLTENTQRSSDNLRIQRNKEAKEKSKRPGELDESALSTDVNNMSDDMLGDMDPDLFGKGGAQAFRRAWEEEEEESKPKDKEKEEEGGSQQQEPRDQSDSQQGKEEGAPQKEADKARVQGTPLERPAAEAPQPAAAKAEAAVKEQAERPERLQLSSEARQATATASPEQKEPPLREPAPSLSTREAEPSRFEASKPPPGAPVLFDLSAGFLIAEEFHVDLNEEEAAAAQVEEAQAEVAPDMADLLEKLIIGDMSAPSYRKLQNLLSRFGKGVIRLCLEKGSKVYLLPGDAPLTSHPLLATSLSGDAVDGAYLASARACVFEEAGLNRTAYGFQPVLYYFGCAFDHALGGEEFASLRSPAVKASYQACLDGPHRFADPMAALSPVHYFAQAIESYLSENDSLEAIWTRQDLYDFDRSMFEYIDYLFRRQNKS